MLKTVTRITIYQSLVGGKENAPNFRPLAMQFYSCHSAMIDMTWDNTTQKAQIIIPARIRDIGAVEYNLDDFKSIDSNIFTQNIEGAIAGLNSGHLDPLKQGTGNRLLKNTVSKIINDKYSIINTYQNLNQGKNYNTSGFRNNPLIQRGDIIVIQLGYIMLNKDNNTVFNTIASYAPISTGEGGSNVGFPNELSSKLPPSYAANIGGTFEVDYRWQPYNRAYQFKGYISKTGINNEGNIQIDCEDFMYLFNRARIPNMKYDPNDKKAPNGKGWTINDIITDMITGSRGPTMSGIQNIDQLPLSVIQPTKLNGANGLTPDLNSFLDVDTSLNFNTTLGTIALQNATIGQVFQTLKDDYGMQVFFRPNTDFIVCSPFVYNNYDANNPFVINSKRTSSDNVPSLGQEEFTFIMGNWSSQSDVENVDFIPSTLRGKYTFKNQQNIIKSNLEFRKSDDQLVGVNVKSIFKLDSKLGGSEVFTGDGRKKKKLIEHVRHVGPVGGTDLTTIYLVTSETMGNADSSYPILKSDGTVNVDNLNIAMDNWGWNFLSKINYTGLYGNIVVAGYPYIQFSDVVNIVDLSFPERSGRYYVKGVTYNASVEEGYTQTIKLDYKIPNRNI